MIFFTKLKDKTSLSTKEVIIQKLFQLPRYTITLDNGSENQQWQEIEQKIDTTCFFAHPYSSWERGTNESTNGLVRWYFPKGTDFRTIPEETIKAVEYALNTRPRKRHKWKTPLEVFNQSVALHC